MPTGRTFDSENEVLDIDGATISATGDQTAVTINGFIGDESYVGVVNIISNGGTPAATDYMTLGLEMSSDGTNYYPVGNVVSSWDVTDSTAQTGLFEIGFTGNQAIEAAGGSNPTHARITAVKAGTAQTNIVAGCYLAKS